MPKKVLITGANSYIGTSFEKWVLEHYSNDFLIDTVDMIDGQWRNKDFSGYDTVFHVAGIAHADVGSVSDEIKQKYYKVNTDLAIETAKKARSERVAQFVFMSSMIVYGESAGYGKRKVITKETEPSPANFYGDSKWQADKGVRELQSGGFNVAVLRPPMIYGKGSKGNYPMLEKLAKKLPVFPDVENERSMLYIDNLCEFLCQLILSGKSGIYFPQNSEYTKTSDMVKMIAIAGGHKIFVSKLFNPLVWIASKIPGKVSGLCNKAFGSISYDMGMSEYKGWEYRMADLDRSIALTENNDKNNIKKDPLVSLITVSFNSEKTIKKTIESVLNQSYSSIEYIIKDGGSTDNTVNIAKQYEPLFKEKGFAYKIISAKDNGIYDAMNIGIKMSQGEIIGIINSDDWYENDAVSIVVDTYKKTGFDYYYADIRLVKNDHSFIIKHSKKDILATSRHWNHPTCFVKKKVYDELGVFKCKGIHDDFDFFLRVRKAGKKIVIENKVLANFAVGGVSNDKSFSKCKKRCSDRYKCYRDNGYSRLYWFECVGIEAAKYVIS